MQERRILLNTSKVPEGAVDLGLPSGVLWAKGNICKDSNGNYYIGEETDYGCYFSWGNIDGNNEGDSYTFNLSSYNNTPGYNQIGTILSGDASHDAALARLGSPWRMPTKEEHTELKNNTDCENATINGVTGLKVMNKSDHSIFIFFPYSGYNIERRLLYKNEAGGYWNTYNTNSDSAGYGYGGMMSVGYNSISVSNDTKYYGYPIRAVRSVN